MIGRRQIELTCFLLLLVYNYTFGQKEASVWYFGNKIGIDFNQSPPALLADGKITADGVSAGADMESAASIADENGQLLFYTNGMTVWNRLHEVMPNGIDLFGENTTTQTLIVPRPGSTTLFYIFTASPQGDHEFFPVERRGFRYSVVDMSADSGFGDVLERNALLSVSTTEKMASTQLVLFFLLQKSIGFMVWSFRQVAASYTLQTEDVISTSLI